MPSNDPINPLLGYPADARLLIVNADDFGMSHAVNAAVIGALQEGIVSSTTLMVPCPWMLHAIQFLEAHPETPFGVHLTAISEWVDYRWGPLTPREKVPSLVDQAGYFFCFEQMPDFFAQVNLDELQMEFRAQIEFVLATGLRPTHLDWHALRIGASDDIFELMLALAQASGLALRVAGQARIEKVKGLGLPTADYDFLDSYLLDSRHKAAKYTELLRELPAGLSEWAVHPGLNNVESLAISLEGAPIRQADYDFSTSRQAKDVIEEEGIILLDYRALQDIWRESLHTGNDLRS